MKASFTLIALTTVAINLAACTSMNNPAYKAPGKYESSSKTTSSSGTTVTKDKTTNVEVDEYGNRRATVETETSTDPKGLMNKSSSSSTTTYRAQ